MFSLIEGLIGTLTLILWIWAIIDVIRKFEDDTSKTIVWLIIIFCFPVGGALIYFWLRNRNFRKKRKFDPNFGETI